ncbi:phosphatase PAP2 family protein [Candidatus Woesearchaeota archaeon]|nr:phosphatase PAP2 family protein [Candidatus Woesearchaeota archaeon]
MLKLPFRIISLTASTPIFILIIAYATYINIISLNHTILMILSFIASTIIIATLRMFFKKESRNQKSFETTFIKKFGITNKSKIHEFFEKIKKRQFISGHVTRTTIIAYTIFLNSFTEFYIYAAIYILIISASRIILNRHNVVDCILGIILGIITTHFLNLFLF